MALVRILVDGYSVLQCWPALAPGKPRLSELAREELISHLTQYFDASGTPITIVFDGDAAPFDAAVHPSTDEVEVVFTRHGQKPSQLIERLAGKLDDAGGCLVASNDPALAAPLSHHRAKLSTPQSFIESVEQTLADLEREIEKINEMEHQKFTLHD